MDDEDLSKHVELVPEEAARGAPAKPRTVTAPQPAVHPPANEAGSGRRTSDTTGCGLGAAGCIIAILFAIGGVWWMSRSHSAEDAERAAQISDGARETCEPAIESLRERADEAEGAAEDLSGELDDAKARIDDLETRIVDLELRIDDLESRRRY